MPDGLEDTPIAWSYDDPHAATVVQYPSTLESLQIDGAMLVAVVGREHAWAPGDGGANEWVLLRGVVGCKAGPTLACRGWFPEVDAPSLGIKHRAWDAKTPWAQIAWDRAPSFTLTASGTLDVAP